MEVTYRVHKRARVCGFATSSIKECSKNMGAEAQRNGSINLKKYSSGISSHSAQSIAWFFLASRSLVPVSSPSSNPNTQKLQFVPSFNTLFFFKCVDFFFFLNSSLMLSSMLSVL